MALSRHPPVLLGADSVRVHCHLLHWTQFALFSLARFVPFSSPLRAFKEPVALSLTPFGLSRKHPRETAIPIMITEKTRLLLLPKTPIQISSSSSSFSSSDLYENDLADDTDTARLLSHCYFYRWRGILRGIMGRVVGVTLGLAAMTTMVCWQLHHFQQHNSSSLIRTKRGQPYYYHHQGDAVGSQRLATRWEQERSAHLGLDPFILNLLRREQNHKHEKSRRDDGDDDDDDDDDDTDTSIWEPPEAIRRCDWVVDRFTERDQGVTTTDPSELAARYTLQSTDANVFYRATARIFWNDFVTGNWGRHLTQTIWNQATLLEGVPLTRKSTWTWVTGDQHLSNFGAWRNRHGEVVFGVNDFDEAAIYDFQIDILRIAVSVTNHAATNGLTKKQVNKVLHVFTKAYVKTVLDYVDNENALLFELTDDTSEGVLKDFIKKVEQKSSNAAEIEKFTNKDPVTGIRRFTKGPIGVANRDTRLATVPPNLEAEIRSQFTSTNYGATMLKVGWAIRDWDEDFFKVVDVAERMGSGVGSYGVARYYVLLKGTDGLLGTNGEDGSHVILDVKYQPPGAVSQVLDSNDAAWYKVLFPNEAARVVEAQRRLTSYTDPYLGWILLSGDGKQSEPQSFSVRQRSPWKDSLELDDLTHADDFEQTMAQFAAATATSHVRGTRAAPPGDFKRVIEALLGSSSKWKSWGRDVARLAHAYREQVLLDFECFQDFVHTKYTASDLYA